jgi:hypothetical protein
VLADHGVSLLPGTPPRTVTDETLPEIAPVPLFVKVPGQSSGAVSDAAVETIDVAPTVLEVVGVEAAPDLDGRSLLDPSAAARDQKRLVDAVGAEWRFAPSQAPLFESTARKTALFGSGAEFDLYGITPAGSADLLGRRVPAAAPATTAKLTVTLQRPAAFERVSQASLVIPALVTGRVNGELPADAVLAIAVNGRIGAVTRVAEDGGFRALLPPETLRNGANDVAVLLASPSGRLETIPPAG